MPQPGSKERRRAPRVKADLPLTLRARDAHETARLSDISTIGLSCHFPEPIPEMTVVRVGLEIGSELHEIDGAVVRCERESPDSWDVAVYFTSIDDAARARLDHFIGERLPHAAP